jgi:hypothetical protein
VPIEPREQVMKLRFDAIEMRIHALRLVSIKRSQSGNATSR